MKWNPSGATGDSSVLSGLPQERTPKNSPLPPQIESAEGMVDALVEHRMITMREGRLLSYFLSFLGDHVTEKDKEKMIVSLHTSP